MSYKNYQRLFAFGCSITSYNWLTWADIIGVNFPKYYNYGLAGCSNTFIMNRFFEVNKKHKFDKNTDLVMIGITGFGRFTYWPRRRNWYPRGDIAHGIDDPTLNAFLTDMWSEDWAVYQSWIAISSVKQLLDLLGIDYKFFQAVEIDHYLSKELTDIKEDSIKKAQEVVSWGQGLNFEHWKTKNKLNAISPYFHEQKGVDGHPSGTVYLKFVQDHFPEFLSEKSNELVDYWEKNFDHSASINMTNKFNKNFKANHDLGFLDTDGNRYSVILD